MRETVDPSLCGRKDDILHEISQVHAHELSLLLNVAQSNGKPLLMGSYTERTVIQMTDRVAEI